MWGERLLCFCVEACCVTELDTVDVKRGPDKHLQACLAQFNSW